MKLFDGIWIISLLLIIILSVLEFWFKLFHLPKIIYLILFIPPLLMVADHYKDELSSDNDR